MNSCNVCGSVAWVPKDDSKVVVVCEVCESRGRYRWRPIVELHEDFGPCVGINIHDPGYLVVVHANDVEQDEFVTHFTRITSLTCEEVEKMQAARAIDAPDIGGDIDEETGTADDRVARSVVDAARRYLDA